MTEHLRLERTANPVVFSTPSSLLLIMPVQGPNENMLIGVTKSSELVDEGRKACDLLLNFSGSGFSWAEASRDL